VCGGILRARCYCCYIGGLSPRVRGHPSSLSSSVSWPGSIPTCAGASLYNIQSSSDPEVYPHVCGGITNKHRTVPPDRGLSPRVRGHRQGVSIGIRWRGSIPTCAGASPQAMCHRPKAQVYPHVCGGISQRVPSTWIQSGLSPRVRGHPHLISGHGRVWGSIPTCAGASFLCEQARRWAGVYPHVCGGIFNTKRARHDFEGLSPRVRGHQLGAMVSLAYNRSIPTCAGASCTRNGTPRTRKVYPHVCGGILRLHR